MENVAAIVWLAFNLNATSMHLSDMFDNGQAQSGPLQFSTSGRVRKVESFKQARKVIDPQYHNPGL